MVRELVVLGTASQVPTRRRNHNGYFLRWDATGFLFDPGEGTQRQLLLAGIPVSAITCICITHFHGDHCLGLPGVLQRMSLDGVTRPVPVAFPAAGADYFARLRHASVFEDRLDVRPVPVDAPADGTPVPVLADREASLTLRAASLAHGVPTVGWQVEEDAGRTMLPDRLTRAGVSGAVVGQLQREGSVVVEGERVALEDVSVARPGQRVAVVMDTGRCAGAAALAAGVDLLVCEATYAEEESALAASYGHLTAGQAGALAADGKVRRLVLTHFSQRYRDVSPLLAEARATYDGDVAVAEDLDRIGVPPRADAAARAEVGWSAPG